MFEAQSVARDTARQFYNQHPAVKGLDRNLGPLVNMSTNPADCNSHFIDHFHLNFPFMMLTCTRPFGHRFIREEVIANYHNGETHAEVTPATYNIQDRYQVREGNLMVTLDPFGRKRALKMPPFLPSILTRHQFNKLALDQGVL